MMSFSRNLMGFGFLATAVFAATVLAQGQTGTRDDQWQPRDDRAWSDRQPQAWGERNVERSELRDRTARDRMGRSGMAGRDLYSPELERASELIGMDVVDVRGVRVGDIEDLAIDTDHGVVAYAVIDRRLTRDMEGERTVAVPFTVLRPQFDRDEVLLETDGRLLSRLRAADENDYARLNNKSWAADVHRMFGVQPYWVASGRAARMGPARDRDIVTEDIYGYRDQEWEQGSQQRRPESRQGEWGRARDRQSAQRGEWEGVDQWSEDQDVYSRDETDRGMSMWERERRGELDRDRQVRGMRIEPRLRTTGPNEPGRVVRASTIMGEDVEGSRDETISQLEDLMIDVNTCGVAYAVVSGEGDALHGVPWTMVHFRGSVDNPRLTMDMTENELVNAPSFDSDNWPDMANPSWTRSVHSYFGVQPSWTYYGYIESGDQMQRPGRFQQGQRGQEPNWWRENPQYPQRQREADSGRY